MSDEEDEMRIRNSLYIEGLNKGSVDGGLQEKQNIAREMLSRNMDINLISELTKLSKDAMETLK